MIRELAKELAPHVRVNGVGPGGTLTNLRGTDALGHAERSIADKAAQAKERIAAALPLRFAQEADDHAGIYVLLASRENSRAVTGQIIMSDGGVDIRPL
jgi:cis-3,4-dihydrophenanthrene-3,4-diol dehydrogenase